MELSAKFSQTSRGHKTQKETFTAIIERDYTCTTAMQFIEECPLRIQHIVDRQVIVSIVSKINQILAQAEKVTYIRLLRNVANVLSLGLIDTFAPSPIEVAMREVDAYIEKQNESVLRPLGVVMRTPSESGMLQITIESV